MGKFIGAHHHSVGIITTSQSLIAAVPRALYKIAVKYSSPSTTSSSRYTTAIELHKLEPVTMYIVSKYVLKAFSTAIAC